MMVGQLFRVIRMVIISSEDNVPVTVRAGVLVHHLDDYRYQKLAVSAA